MAYYVYILSPGFLHSTTQPPQATPFRMLTVQEQLDYVRNQIIRLRTQHTNPNDLVFFLMHEYFFWQLKDRLDFIFARKSQRYLSYEEYKVIQNSLEELSKNQGDLSPIIILAGLAVLDSFSSARAHKILSKDKKLRFVQHLRAISEPSDYKQLSFDDNAELYKDIRYQKEFDYGKNLVIICEDGHHTNIHKSIPFHEPMPSDGRFLYTNYDKSFPFYRLKCRPNRLIAVEICVDHKSAIAYKSFLYHKAKIPTFFQPDDVLDFHFVLSDSIQYLEYALSEANYLIHADIFYKRQALMLHDAPPMPVLPLSPGLPEKMLTEPHIPKLVVFDVNISNLDIIPPQTEIEVTKVSPEFSQYSIKWK